MDNANAQYPDLGTPIYRCRAGPIRAARGGDGPDASQVRRARSVPAGKHPLLTRSDQMIFTARLHHIARSRCHAVPHDVEPWSGSERLASQSRSGCRQDRVCPGHGADLRFRAAAVEEQPAQAASGACRLVADHADADLRAARIAVIQRDPWGGALEPVTARLPGQHRDRRCSRRDSRRRSDAIDGPAQDRTPTATATSASAVAHETFRFLRTLSLLLPHSGRAAANT
jgi:hypothetical protein